MSRPDPQPASQEAGPEGVDELLARLEATARRLAEPNAPIERLAADYAEGVELLAEAERRLADLTPPDQRPAR